MLVFPVSDSAKMLESFLSVRERFKPYLFSVQDEVNDYMRHLYRQNGYLLQDDGDTGWSGAFVLAPYSPAFYPKPVFPNAWRPKSNFAQIQFIAYDGKEHITSVIQAFCDSMVLRNDLIFPLTVTAHASTEKGLLLQYISGFIRVFGGDLTQQEFGAVKINDPMDSVAFAKPGWRNALKSYRSKVGTYQLTTNHQ
jgi:hypothetical protein